MSFEQTDLPEIYTPEIPPVAEDPVRSKRATIEGCLYVMTSSWMPVDHYKVGLSSNLSSRLAQYATSHLEPKFIITSPACANPNMVYKKGENEPKSTLSFIYYRETAVHQILSNYRCTSNREFFKCKLEDIAEAFVRVENMSDMELVAFITNTKYICSSSETNLQAKVESLTKELQEAKTKISELEQQLQPFLIERDGGKQGKAWVTLENIKLREQIKELKESSADGSSLKTEVEALKQELVRMTTLKADLELQTKETQQYKTHYEDSQKTIKELGRKYDICKSDLKESLKSIDELSRDRSKECDKLFKELESCKEQLEKAKKEAEKSSSDKKEKVNLDVEFTVEPKNNYSLPTCAKCTDLLDGWKQAFTVNNKCDVKFSIETYKGARIVSVKIKNCKTDLDIKHLKNNLKETFANLFSSVYGEIAKFD